MAKKNTLTLLLSLLLGLLILAYVISTAGWSDIANAFEMLSFYKYLFVFGFFFVIYLIILARWGIILSAIGYHLPFAKLLSLRLSEWAFGYITPFSRMGGEPLLAYLFKKECKIEYKKGIAAIVLNKVLDFAAALILAVIGILLFLFNYGGYLSEKVSFAILFAVLLLSAIIYMFFVKIAKKEGFFSRISVYFKKIFHSSIHNGIVLVEKELHNFFIKNKRKIVITMCISLIIDLLTIANYKILALFLGINLSFIQLLMIFALITVAYLVPTPGSLGSLEGALALAFYAMGYGAGIGVAFALILRSFELILTGMGLLFISYFGIKLKGFNQ
jgi:uncharacterized protein (TIRG00374 family)